MTFTYSITVASGYCSATDEYDEEDISFEYEVDDERIENAIVDIIYNECFSSCGKQVNGNIRDFIDTYDLWDDLWDDFKDKFEDELYVYFEDEAKMRWKNETIN